jgi:hypothetical protein
MKKFFILGVLLVLIASSCKEQTKVSTTTLLEAETTSTTIEEVIPQTCSEVALGSLTVTEEYLKICLDAGDLIMYFPCPDGEKLYLTGFDDKTIAIHVGVQPKVMLDGYTDVELMSICDWESV